MRKIHNTLVHRNICEEHGIFDLFPCPWPGCPKGIPESEFEVPSLIQGKESTIYQRHEWINLAQEKYYTWQEKDFPNWFFCKKTLWSEAKRRKLITSSPVKTIYHYTSIEGFMGILDSRSLWFTDYSYLNDRKELCHGIDVIRRVAGEIQEQSSNAKTCKLLSSWQDNLQTIDNGVWIASFSSDGDSLSQWRAYGGIAIGFDIHSILLNANYVFVHPVVYNEHSQHELAKIYLNHLCQAYSEDISTNLLEQTPNLYHEKNQFVELASIFKDSSFRDEHEYRAVLIEHSRLTESVGLKKPKKHFRHTNGHIIPYVSSNEIYPLDGQKSTLEFEEIVLGPNSDEMLERGIREMLVDHGMGGVSIKRSKVPYRT